MTKAFSKQVEQFGEDALQLANLSRQKIGIEIFNRVIMRSPVDTGAFRGSWQATRNRFASGDVARFDNDSPVTENGSGSSSTKKIMESVVLESVLQESLHLTNNKPYAVRLENGWSQQAAGKGAIVEASVIEYRPTAVAAMKAAKASFKFRVVRG